MPVKNKKKAISIEIETTSLNERPGTDSNRRPPP